MKLKQFTIESGGKFTPQAPVVVDFQQSKMAGGTGDEGAGKSTLIELFLMNVGQLGGKEVVEALTNKETGQLKTGLTFEHERAEYEVRNTNGRLTLKKEGATTPGGPQELLKQMIGVVGVSPMALKNADIDDIVKWLASYSVRGADEFKKQMLKIKDGIKVAKKARADANRSAKGIREYLFSEGYVDEKGELIEKVWKDSEKTFKEKPNITKLSAELKAAGDKSDKYVQFETKLAGKKERKKQIEDEIKELQKELVEVQQNITDGDAWISRPSDLGQGQIE